MAPAIWNYDTARDFLDSRKVNKRSAKIANNTWLVRVDDTFVVRYHHTAIVTYHPGNSVTVWHGGWQTPTTLQRLREYTRGVVIHSIKGEWHVGDTGQRTPARVQKCRKCHGTGTLPRHCFDHQCYPGYDFDDTGRWTQRACGHGEKRSHRLDTCPTHNLPGGHEVAPDTCWRCQGAGKVDYGSKVIRYRFDAPMLIDEDGVFIAYTSATPCPSVEVKKHAHTGYVYPQYATSVRAHNRITGDTVHATLERAIPGFARARVTPPCDCMLPDTPLATAVMHLNDRHTWTREAIADWLDTLDFDLRFQPISA